MSETYRHTPKTTRPWWRTLPRWMGGVLIVVGLLYGAGLGLERKKSAELRDDAKRSASPAGLPPLPPDLPTGYAAIDGRIEASWADKVVFVPTDQTGLLAFDLGALSFSPTWGPGQTYVELSGPVTGRHDASFSTHGDWAYDGPKRARQLLADYHPMIMHVRLPLGPQLEREAISARAVFEYTYGAHGQTSNGSVDTFKEATFTIIPVNRAEFDILALHTNVARAPSRFKMTREIWILVGIAAVGVVFWQIGGPRSRK